MNIEDIEFQMDPDSNFKTETNHILEDGKLLKKKYVYYMVLNFFIICS